MVDSNGKITALNLGKTSIILSNRDFMKTIIDEANDEMPLYKRVKRFHFRYEEFEKTTTKKIKRVYNDSSKEVK